MERVNNRGFKETAFEKKHMSLEDLKGKLPDNKYIWKKVALLSMPVEFRVSKVSHVTDEKGLRGIIENGGFRVESDRYPRAGEGSGFLWWGLSIGRDDVAEAERRYLEQRFPGRMHAEASFHKPFLHQLATSTAFQEGSRFGNFKFSFQLSDLLQEYSLQFCSGRKPALRVFETVVYRREILYSVVVHDPDDHSFDEYPPLEGSSNSICALKQGCFIWRARAISDTYKFFVEEDAGSKMVHVEEMPYEKYYLWQNVALAFHLPVGVTFLFGKDPLLRQLSACEILFPNLSGVYPMSLEEAEKAMKDLKS